MADDQKWLSPQELHLRQKELERLDAQAKAAKEAEFTRALEEKRQRDIQSAIDKARATWRPGVQDGFGRPGVRFVVVAKVNRDCHPAATVFVNEVRRLGFLCEITSGVAYRELPVGDPKDSARPVNRGPEPGWCIAAVPTIGSAVPGGAPEPEDSLIIRLPPV